MPKTTGPLDQIGDLLREARKRVGLTQADLAERMRTDSAAISKYENGKTDYTVSTLNRWCSALGFNTLRELAGIAPTAERSDAKPDGYVSESEAFRMLRSQQKVIEDLQQEVENWESSYTELVQDAGHAMNRVLEKAGVGPVERRKILDTVQAEMKEERRSRGGNGEAKRNR